MTYDFGKKNNLALVVLSLQIVLLQSHFASAQEPAPQAKPKMDFTRMPADPRIEMRSYLFKETAERMEYALFVSSKVTQDKKNPVIVTLHGLGAPPRIMFMGPALDLAEEGGYILVGPMGYNVRGWYGVPTGGKPSKPDTPPKPAKKPETVTEDGKTAPKAKAPLFFDPNDPPNLSELSEKDVMNVLEIVRKEFNVDERRIYLMGHSMGGAGTLYLGTRYPSIWAALAPIAPAAFGLNPDILEKIKDIPVIFVHGEADEVVPGRKGERIENDLRIQ